MNCLKTTILCTMLAASSITLSAQTDLQTPATNATAITDLKNVVHIAGLNEVKPNVSGDLTLSLQGLTFHNKHVESSIARERIVNAYLGSERTEPWGTTGKIARKIIPYGGGEVLSTLTNKKVDVLTVEYRDIHDGYHGAVFVLPAQTAAAVRDSLLAGRTTRVEQPAPSCDTPLSQSVLLAPIQVRGSELPEEYRVLIYEQTLRELKAGELKAGELKAGELKAGELKVKRPEERFFRVGDRAAGAGCAAWTLHITVTHFKKGNRAVRASTGPLGFFLGATSLTFEVRLQDAGGEIVFASQIKKSDRTDSESLGLADSIAKHVAKSFDKATESSTVQVASLR
jgi:hypothetical protein